MKLYDKLMWLDDVRYPPSEKWTWVKTAAEALALLKTKDVLYASLDHDLGPDHYPWSETYSEDSVRKTSGQAVTHFLEREFWVGDKEVIPPFGVRVHSMNTVGASKMVKAVEAIYGENFQADTQYEVLPWQLFGQPNGWFRRNTTPRMVELYRSCVHSQ